MAKVFLSYDRDDTERARPLALALEKAGHSVWWDLHIRGGAQYTKVIEDALAASDAVVVLWSAFSIESAWVRDEAAAGRDSGRLVPVMLDKVNPPMGFRQFQGLDFSNWKGRGRPPAMADLLASIEGVAGTESDTPLSVQTAIEPAKVRLGLPKWAAIAIAAILIFAIAGYIYQSKRNSHGTYTVAVTAADKGSTPLARDLLVNLGQLQAAQPSSLRLVGSDVPSDDVADLLFEVSGDSSKSQSRASLILLGKDRSLLWSKDFQQPSGKLADLKQQLAFTAGRVLRCAFEGLDFKGTPLKAQTFKTYLNGCSEIEETGGDPSSVVPTMRKVIGEEPRFLPAWAIMLMAQAGKAEEEILWGGGAREQQDELRRMVANAREIDPNLAEATLAEISLIPLDDHRKIQELADKAYVQSPTNPVVLGTRSNLLRRVGRMGESVDDARRAADLDPLSPLTRNNYISALFYAGRFESARQELARAEQLWPGTDTLLDVKFRFHLRYGDPNEALKIAQAQALDPGMEMLLNARIHPTAENVRMLMDFLGKRSQTRGPAVLSSYLQAAGEFGLENEAFDKLLTWPRPRDLAYAGDTFFRPSLKKLRSDPRFMQVAKRSGLLEYWQSSGKWPDFCSEPGLPYDCKKEAARLLA